MQVMHNTHIHMQRFRLAPSSPVLWKTIKCHRLLVVRAVPQRPEMAAVHDRQAATDTVGTQQQSSADGNNSAKLTPSQRRNLRRKRKAAFKQDTSQDEAASKDTEPGKQAVLQRLCIRPTVGLLHGLKHARAAHSHLGLS